MWLWPKIFVDASRIQLVHCVFNGNGVLLKTSCYSKRNCPLSPLLFILALELLAIKICNFIDVKGIECWDRECLFADDILMLILSPFITLPNLSAILQPFSISGLKRTCEKSQALNISLREAWEYFFFFFLEYLPRWMQHRCPRHL